MKKPKKKPAGRPPGPGGTMHSIGLRLDDATVARVDAFLVKLRARSPTGVLLSRADALRVLLARALQAEKDA